VGTDIFETKSSYKETAEYKEFEQEMQHVRSKSCVGCVYKSRQPGGMCGLASCLCVNADSKPYYKSLL